MWLIELVSSCFETDGVVTAGLYDEEEAAIGYYAEADLYCIELRFGIGIGIVTGNDTDIAPASIFTYVQREMKQLTK